MMYKFGSGEKHRMTAEGAGQRFQHNSQSYDTKWLFRKLTEIPPAVRQLGIFSDSLR